MTTLALAVHYHDTMTDYLAQLTNLANGIVTASDGGWEITQSVTFNSTSYAITLSHPDTTAQICLVHRAVLHVDNCYGAAGTTSYLKIAYKPSTSAEIFDTIDNDINPVDTSTFCSDAGSFLFMTIDAAFQSASILYIVVDQTSPNLWFLFYDASAAGAPSLDMYVVILDVQGNSFLESVDGLDGNLFFCNPTVNFTGTNMLAQHNNSVGTILEGCIFSTVVPKTWKYDALRGPQTVGRIEVTRTETGRVGLLDDRALAAVRTDSRGNKLLEHPTEENMRWYCPETGFLIPWPANEDVPQ